MKKGEYQNLKKGDVIVFNDHTEAVVEGKTLVAGQEMTAINMGDFGQTVLLSPLVKLKTHVTQEK